MTTASDFRLQKEIVEIAATSWRMHIGKIYLFLIYREKPEMVGQRDS
jgi:hypothetical protein